MSAKLNISDELKLPAEVAGQTQAILAIKGAGKTYAAMKMMETMVDAGFQCVAIDPTGVWHGLVSSADGKGPGIEAIIMGGEHGNVPLESTSGEIIAEFIVDSGQSVVLDLSSMRKAEMHRFMAAFLDRLYHYKANRRESLHIFFDEADTAAPQKPGPEQTKVLGAAEDVVRRGRSRGLGMTMITQRPAVLNKNLLEMCDTLYVMRVVGSLDQAAVRSRVSVDGDPDDVRRMMEGLATLANGEAWVWSPSALQVFKRIRFAAKRTFDSSRTPKPGERAAVPKARTEFDLAKLSERIRATVERAKENDPKALKSELAKLRQQLAARPKEQVEKVVEKIVERPAIDAKQLKQTEGIVERLEREGAKQIEAGNRLVEAAKLMAAALRATQQQPARQIQPMRPQTPPRPVVRREVQPNAGGVAVASGRLPIGERAVLRACIQFPDGVTREQLTVLTGYKRSSRDAYIQRLREKGMVEAQGDAILATQSGVDALPDAEPLPTGDALRDYWRGRLPTGELAIFNLLTEAYPNALPRDELSTRTGYQRSSRDAYLQRMNAKRLIEIVGRGEVKASDQLF